MILAHHDWELIERDDGWEVRQDRRVWIDRLDYDEATAYIERRRKPDERAFAETVDGDRREITRDLRRARVRA